MMTTCGHSFSEETITNWVAKKNQCPLCNKPLKKSDITPNYALRNAIARYFSHTPLKLSSTHSPSQHIIILFCSTNNTYTGFSLHKLICNKIFKMRLEMFLCLNGTLLLLVLMIGRQYVLHQLNFNKNMY